MTIFSPTIAQLRWGSALLRKWRPIVSWGNATLVSLHEDVCDVLSRPQDFSVVPVYAAKMHETSGDFILGMDDDATYRREAGILRDALHRTDPGRIRGLVREAAAVALRPGREGTFDVVAELTRRVPTQLVETFFGVKLPEKPSDMERWLRSIFWHLFLNLDDDPQVAARAKADAEALRNWLDRCIPQVRDEPGGHDTLLSGLVANPSGLDDAGIRRNIGGVIVGSVDTVSKAAAFALDALLDRPEELAAAQKAARRGDVNLVAGYASEALRFNPHTPAIFRVANRDTTVGVDPDRRVAVAKGTRVVALTMSAMFDERQVASPDEFNPSRFPRFHLQFGDGMHTCYGLALASVEIPELLMPLLRCRSLRRAPRGGTIAMEGPFPDRLLVEIDARPG